jgi:hypothetical protein
MCVCVCVSVSVSVTLLHFQLLPYSCQSNTYRTIFALFVNVRLMSATLLQGFFKRNQCWTHRLGWRRPFKAQLSLYVWPSLTLKSSTFRLHSQVYVLYGYQNKRGVFPWTISITEAQCLLRGAAWIYKFNSGQIQEFSRNFGIRLDQR